MSKCNNNLKIMELFYWLFRNVERKREKEGLARDARSKFATNAGQLWYISFMRGYITEHTRVLRFSSHTRRQALSPRTRRRRGLRRLPPRRRRRRRRRCLRRLSLGSEFNWRRCVSQECTYNIIWYKEKFCIAENFMGLCFSRVINCSSWRA